MDRSFDEALVNVSVVAVAGHRRPDGDAIGSCYAMAHYLNRLGKDVKVLLEDYDSRYDDAIPGRQYLYTGDYDALSPDMFIAMDTSAPERLGRAKSVLERARVTAVFDHHLEGVDAGHFDHTSRDTQAPSTTMILYKFLNQRIALDVDISSAIYAGLVYDTGGFRHPSTTPECM